MRADEITAVGIEILISEETETEALKQAAKLSAASLRLETDPPPPKQARPSATRADAPPSAVARSAAAEPAKPAPAQSAQAKPAQPPPHKPAVKPSTTAGGSLLASTGTGPQIKPPSLPRALAPTTGLDAFFRGAGLPAQRLDEKQTELVLHVLGQLMREVIVGLGESLHVRAEQKSLLRIPNTTIQPQNNNPLKFAASVDESMNNLLFRESAEYMSAVDAVREAFVDIKLHQQSLLSALKTALGDYVGRLDPDDLENKFSNGKRGGLMNAANKLKYWDLYKDLFQVVTQQVAGQLPQLFAEDMARAYEQESARSGGSQTRKPQAKIAS